jgi:transketolase
VFVGDGCLMEGVSHEACSLAGNQGLGKLIVFWDDNGISIDGEVEAWFSDDTPARFRAYGWQVIAGVDGHDAAQISAAIKEAQAESDKPTLICCKTVIGKGSPNKAGSESCHGSPLGEEEVALVRESLGWSAEPFEVPESIATAWDATVQGAERENAWQKNYDDWAKANPDKAAELKRRLAGELPQDWENQSAAIVAGAETAAEKLATRKASLKALNAFGPMLPEFIGGSADLAGSNYTIWDQSKPVSATEPNGNYIYFGVREFAMAAIANGLALYGGFKPYTGTFLVFSDYMRNGLRMSALMGLPVIHILTHDSIGLGEDGPTHQPIEHTSSLRMIPNMSVWRPCDVVESMVAWKVACEQKAKPSCLIFSRQGLPHQPRNEAQLAAVSRGGYVLLDCNDDPELIIIATGSEVALATDAAKQLNAAGKRVRVVSMPSTDVFDQQDEDYREAVLPRSVTRRLAIEAGSEDYWARYVGLDGAVIGMSGYGESAPAEQLFQHFGFTLENVIETCSQLLDN